ncbi:MAG TPA: hypothetical protein PKH19_01250, partial [Candidatus Syntrophosphaera sp.]|nr:hypothetical protein [Candidatus Syntrophosphaera sp.]
STANGKVPVVLSDMGNMVNGYASPVGAKMGLFAYPPSGDELGLGEDWWQLVGVHEYIHMAQMTRTTGEPALLRALFGNLLYPNLYQPMWMTEGITVYGESQLSQYTGRLNAGTYPAIISALAREGRLPSPGKACYYSYSNPLGNYYVYGSAFHQYLSDTYGEDKFAILYGETSSSLASYLNPITSSLSLDKAYQTAFGKDVATLWADWQNDAAAKSAPLPQQRLTQDGWQKDNLRFHNGALYYTARKVSKTGPSSTFSSYRLMRLERLDAKPKAVTLIEQNSDFSAGYQIAGDRIYYSRSEFETGYANNDYDGRGVITQLWSANLDGGGKKRLFEGQIRSFCVLDGGRILIAEDDATHQNTLLAEISLPAGARRDLGTLNYLIGSLVQNQGKIYASARKFWQNNSVYLLNLSNLQLTPLIDTPNMETLVYATDRELVFNATYNGKNGCYAYNLANRAVTQLSGFAEIRDAALTPQGRSYFISINGDGYDVYQDQLRSQTFTLPPAKSAQPPYSRISGRSDKILGQYQVKSGTYAKNIGHLLWPRLYRLPYIDIKDQDETLDSLVVGIQVAGADVVGDFPLWTAAVLYDLNNQDWGYQFGLQNDFLRPLKQSLEYTNLGGKSFSAVQELPFLQRLNCGLSYASAGFGFLAQNDFTRKVWSPFLSLNFAAPGWRWQTQNKLMFETRDFLPSDRERLGWQGRFNLRLKAPLSTELRNSVFAAYDPDAEKDEVFSYTRGYDEKWLQKSGVEISNSWYAPILKIRDGLWNPNIYLEDINLGLFYDYAYPWDQEKDNIRWAYGAELLAEVYFGYNYGANIGIRFSWNRDGEALTSLILGM